MEVFLIEDDGLLGTYKITWDKFNTDVKKEFDSEPVYNKEVWKIKMKSHGDEVKIFMIKKFLRWTLIILI